MNELSFHITVKPKSTQNMLTRQEDGLHLQVTAPANEGAANKAVLTILAKALHLPKKSLAIIAGGSGRVKKIAVRGIDAEELARRLLLL